MLASGQIGKVGDKRPRSPELDSMTSISGVTTSASDSDLSSVRDTDAKAQQLFHLLKSYKKLCLEAKINIRNLTSTRDAEVAYQLVQILSQLRQDMDFGEFSRMTIKETPPETLPGQKPQPPLPPLSVLTLLTTDDEFVLFFLTTELRRFFNEQNVIQKCLTTPAAYDTLFDCLQQLFCLGHRFHLLTLFKFMPGKENLALMRLIEHPAIMRQFSVTVFNTLRPEHPGAQLMQWLADQPYSHLFILHLVMQHPQPEMILTLLNERNPDGACLHQLFTKHPDTTVPFTQWLQPSSSLEGALEQDNSTLLNSALLPLAIPAPCQTTLSTLLSLTTMSSNPQQNLATMKAPPLQEPALIQKSSW